MGLPHRWLHSLKFTPFCVPRTTSHFTRSLQCLSNTELLARYFTELRFLADINLANPLGNKGKIARAYGALQSAMWSGEFRSVSPGPLKQIVGRFAPQFEGFGQQDSQEFLTFLLDGLLEDTCRVKAKPFVPAVESRPGQPDAEVAAEAWEAFQRRNSSAIADIFAGQFRSRVECNQCSRTSITFDPFTSFSVPIPTMNETNVTVLYFDTFGTAPFRYHLSFSRRSSQRALTYGDIASELLRRIKAHLGAQRGYLTSVAAPLPGALAAAAPFCARLPAHASELLITLTSGKPCFVAQAIPHWEEFGGTVPDLHHLFVYHVPGGGVLGSSSGSGSSATTAAAGSAAAASSSSVSSSSPNAAAAAADGTGSSTRGSSGRPPSVKMQRVQPATGSDVSVGDVTSPSADLSDWRVREALVKAAEWRWYYDRARPPPSMQRRGGSSSDNTSDSDEDDGASEEEEDYNNNYNDGEGGVWSDVNDDSGGETTRSAAAALAATHVSAPSSSSSAYRSSSSALGMDVDDEEDDLIGMVQKSAAAATSLAASAPRQCGNKRKLPHTSSSSSAADGVGGASSSSTADGGGGAARSSGCVRSGPGAADFVTVWLRKPGTGSKGGKPFIDAGDSLIIPLRHPITGRRVTNAEFHALVALKIRRMVMGPQRAALQRDLSKAPWSLRFIQLGLLGPEDALPPVAPKGTFV